jgi:hypothetical protein
LTNASDRSAKDQVWNKLLTIFYVHYFSFYFFFSASKQRHITAANLVPGRSESAQDFRSD